MLGPLYGSKIKCNGNGNGQADAATSVLATNVPSAVAVRSGCVAVTGDVERTDPVASAM